MAKSVNQTILMGRLTKDVDLRTTTSGKAIASFSLAVDRYDDGTDFFEVTAWEKLAELVSKYTAKGSKVLVMGRLGQDTWDDKDTGKKRSKVTITATDVTFLDGKSDDTAQRNDFAPVDVAPIDIDDTPVDLSTIPF